ncbi:MAG: OmpA family protein [Bacteroidota bacterium]
MFKILLLSFIIFQFVKASYAQNEANIWYFGKRAGVEFSSGEPVAIENSKLITEEGCASISDKDGNLLFYTNGVTVWNRKHEMMPNGDGLMGHPSSTQSGVIVPKGDNNNIYYLFTIAEQGTANGFRYSIVDMSLADGFGDVSIKNYLLASPVTEKITAVKHRDNVSIWVITHEWQNNRFLAFKINEEGVVEKPVETQIGAIHSGSITNAQGYMKASPDGTQIALALENDHLTEVFDFDNLTGRLSKCIQLQMKEGAYNYGIEFSPSGSLLYVSAAGTGEVYQYNLLAGSVEKIKKSGIKVGASSEKRWIGALQLATNGKIYFPIYGTSYLGEIAYPDSVGLACGYENNAVNLKQGIAQLGLPTFTQSLFTKMVAEQELVYFEPDKKLTTETAFILKNVLFDTGEAILKPTSYVELDKVATLLKDSTSYEVIISGHTDNIGNKSYNIRLSKNRAESVKVYLLSKSIDQKRLKTKGYGSAIPVRSNETEKGREKNRRVTLKLLKQL